MAITGGGDVSFPNTALSGGVAVPGGVPLVGGVLNPATLYNAGTLAGGGGKLSLGGNQTSSQQQATGTQRSTSYIPEYSQTPILEQIAKYAGGMAPQVYQWGMDQFNKNQGNIDTMMRSAMSYASPQRIATDMGQAEAGVQQGAEAGRQSATRDLQGYGIDPSAGRYAALDTANRVMSGAAAAGAGNQATRMADQAQGTAMQNQALSAGLQNVAAPVPPPPTPPMTSPRPGCRCRIRRWARYRRAILSRPAPRKAPGLILASTAAMPRSLGMAAWSGTAAYRVCTTV